MCVLIGGTGRLRQTSALPQAALSHLYTLPLKGICREDTYEYFKEIRDQALRGQACPQIRPAHNLRAVNYGCRSWGDLFVF